MERLIRAFVYDGMLAKEDYEAETVRLRQEKSRLTDALLSLTAENDLREEAVDYGMRLLARASREWLAADATEKSRLQRLFFPMGVRYAAGEFETPERSPFFGLKEAETEILDDLASPTRTALLSEPTQEDIRLRGPQLGGLLIAA